MKQLRTLLLPTPTPWTLLRPLSLLVEGQSGVKFFVEGSDLIAVTDFQVSNTLPTEKTNTGVNILLHLQETHAGNDHTSLETWQFVGGRIKQPGKTRRHINVRLARTSTLLWRRCFPIYSVPPRLTVSEESLFIRITKTTGRKRLTTFHLQDSTNSELSTHVQPSAFLHLVHPYNKVKNILKQAKQYDKLSTNIKTREAIFRTKTPKLKTFLRNRRAKQNLFTVFSFHSSLMTSVEDNNKLKQNFSFIL